MPARSATKTRSKLDRDAVVERALALSDAEGLESVTIRRLAQELSVSPMALYWHFEDKDALLAALADRMWAETAEGLSQRLELDDAGDSWAQLRWTLATLVEVMRRHPDVATLVPSRVMASDAGLTVTEWTLAFLARQGFDLSPAAEIARYVLCSAVMLVTELPGSEAPGPDDVDDPLRAKRIAIASLPSDRYPHVAAAAEYLTDCAAPDVYFARGIDLVVAGVRAQQPAT